MAQVSGGDVAGPLRILRDS